MAKFRSLTIAGLRKIVETTIAEFGEERVTNAQAVQAALPAARAICENDYDAVICGTLAPMVRQTLAHTKVSWTRLPSLIPGLELPYRIAVPTPEMTVDPDKAGDEAAGVVWIVLHRATIAEARRNVAMRDAHIAGAQTERDKVLAVVDMAAAITSDDDAVIGEVLGRRAA